MKISNPFRDLSRFEMVLYIVSMASVFGSFLFFDRSDMMSVAASLIGVTALIFIAKGYVIGQILVVIFAVLYGIISFFFRYYGEVITYLCMTAPIAVISIISWIKHPYQDTKEVEVSNISKKQIVIMLFWTVIVTTAFAFILSALKNANLIVSVFSVTTSFIASYLTFLRSPYYALGYAVNDIVLIVLWAKAAQAEAKYIPMVICFAVFFANDIYGFYNWQKMQKRQGVIQLNEKVKR
ncbi:MAG: nicotinamide mononucleotide transporter [Clostridia bacterium]|nr:nicotinamide mononucleotide transporter [Clostridia bacterium]